jgi:hypothetical protein
LFKIISVYAASNLPNPAGYSPGGQAGLFVSGSVLSVNAEIHGANASSTYTLLVIVNGTQYVLGSILTDGAGNGQVNQTTISLEHGTYEVSLRFVGGSAGPVRLELDTYPSTQTLTIQSTTITSTQSEIQTISDQSAASLTHSATVETLNASGQNAIKAAVVTKFIPLVFSVGASSLLTIRYDQAFSVGYSAPSSTQLTVTVSAKNVGGPRVILFNLTQNSFNLSSHALLVTLDGKEVSKGTLYQILHASSNDGPLVALVGAAGMHELLMSVPHFSVHVIRIQLLPLRQWSVSMAVDVEIVLASVVVLTVLMGLTYKRRTRATSSTRWPFAQGGFS